MKYQQWNENPRKTQPDSYSFTVLLLATLWLGGCAATPSKPQDPHVLARNQDFIVVIAREGDSTRSLARDYLGNTSLYWQIEDFENQKNIKPGNEIVVPLKPLNPAGFDADGFEKVAILCYHRFDDRHIKLSVPEDKFRQQMQYLKDHDYRVVSLTDVANFINQGKPLPKRAVAITIDDGYRSTYDVAFKVLREFNYPATVFLYTDFMGGSDALDWNLIRVMNDSGLIDFQPHSKSHPNMAIHAQDETKTAYEKRILDEINQPADKIKQHLNNNIHTFAYPYGDTNDFVITNLKAQQYNLGVTVQPGGNASFGYPYMLRRTMVFGDFSLEDFQHTLDVYRKLSWR